MGDINRLLLESLYSEYDRKARRLEGVGSGTEHRMAATAIRAGIDALAALAGAWRTDWDNAPGDGTFILGCQLPDEPAKGWHKSWEQWKAPTTISFRSFHPNAPGKEQWRDAKGSPVHCTHWMPIIPCPAERGASSQDGQGPVRALSATDAPNTLNPPPARVPEVEIEKFLKLTGFLPFRIVETPDYAEVHAANGDGKTAFALTMSPSFFEELNAIYLKLTGATNEE